MIQMGLESVGMDVSVQVDSRHHLQMMMIVHEEGQKNPRFGAEVAERKAPVDLTWKGAVLVPFQLLVQVQDSSQVEAY